MTSTTTHELPMILTEIEVVDVDVISPTYVRVVFAADELADLGVDGKFYDQRIKLIFPNAAGELASFEGADRSEEHTSELQSLMRISYAVFCLQKKTSIHKR